MGREVGKMARGVDSEEPVSEPKNFTCVYILMKKP